MKRYYITTWDVANANKRLFCPQDGAHFYDLENGHIIIACNFHCEQHEELWDETPGVEPMPHPQFEGSTPIDPSHHAKLKHHGIEAHHTIVDVAKHFGKLHPRMRIRHFDKL